MISIVRVRSSKEFQRALKKLHRDIQVRAVEALTRLAEDPGRPSLNLEPITGRAGYFSVRVNRAVRILLRRDEDQRGAIFTAVNVGNHDRIYR